MIIQTKVAPVADPAEFRLTFEQSLKNLQLQYVDLLSIHGINEGETLDWSIRKGGCLEMARQLQAEGLCRHVGFSTHATNDLILKAIHTGGFDYVNIHWYFVNELNWSSVEAATALDMGVFIISPHRQGRDALCPARKVDEALRPAFAHRLQQPLLLGSSRSSHVVSGSCAPRGFRRPR